MRRSAIAAGDCPARPARSGCPRRRPRAAGCPAAPGRAAARGAPSAVVSDVGDGLRRRRSRRPPCAMPSGSSSHDMFSTTPTIRWWVCSAIAPARSATSAAASCGVVTTRISAFGHAAGPPRSRCRRCPAAGRAAARRGRPSTRRRGTAAARGAASARATPPAVLPGVNMPIEMTFTPCADGGMIMFSTWVGRSVDAQHPRHRVAVDVGVDHADRQPARGQRGGQVDRHRWTCRRRPCREATAYTRVSEPGWANGITGSARVAAQLLAQLRALLVAHHVELDRAPPVTPGTCGDGRGDARR